MTHLMFKLMKPLPNEEARTYGDREFGIIMMAKVICVQLVNDLGFDLLYQDAGKKSSLLSYTTLSY